LYQFTRRVTKLTVVIIVGYNCYQPHTKKLSNILLSRLSPYIPIDKITGDHNCDFCHTRSTTEQILLQSLDKGKKKKVVPVLN
jgi:hypothetical protein